MASTCGRSIEPPSRIVVVIAFRRPFSVLDGGLSTALHGLGVDTTGRLWTMGAVVERPDVVVAAHRTFVEAGADVVTSASYQCGVDELVASGLDRSAARRALASTTELARRATAGTGALVAVSLGPFGASLADGSEYTGRYAAERERVESYHRDKIEVLVDTDADVVACETIPRADEAAFVAETLAAAGSPPAWFSFGCRDASTTYGGDDLLDAVARVIEYPNLVAVGANCSSPAVVSEALSLVRARFETVPLVGYPNHGRSWNAPRSEWTGDAQAYPTDELVERWIELGVRLVGGCCGVDAGGVTRLVDRRDRAG